MKAEDQGPPELITFPAAARRVGLAPATAERLAHAGKFPAPCWLGGRRYVLQVELTEWLAAFRQKEAPHGQG